MPMRPRLRGYPKTLLLCSVVTCLALVGRSGTDCRAADLPSPVQAAAKINRLLDLDDSQLTPAQPAGQVNDELFLRRAALDLLGRVPTPEQVSAFVLDPDPHKRQHAVQQMLSRGEYGRNWARFWRDTILSRRLEERALLVLPAAEAWLTEQFNNNVGWDKIAREIITATGDVREDGSTLLILAQMGQPEETAAEVSRVFLGVQVQCAQCHDHPTDRWKREQFHHLAAFFPRIAVRPVREANRRSFEVISVNPDRIPPRLRRRLKRSGEHFMPDLQDPSSQGTLMTPALFWNDEKTLPKGTSDATRRGALARWITSPENPWFAKAFVNRMWTELVGEGFYVPVDDLGPDRTCSSPETLELLASQFAASGFDVKWLLATIMATDAYQRAARMPGATVSAESLATCPPRRLRSDQLYDNLLRAIGVAEAPTRGFGLYGAQASDRRQFARTFGFDPSMPRDEVTGSVAQALALMNSPTLTRSINARSTATALGRLVAREKDNEMATVELYLRCLGREPTNQELRTCLEYIQLVGDRPEALEDLLWALINSTEFLHRR